MSFILDALKKSELERQRQENPGLVDSGFSRPRARFPGWAIALGLLLAVNLLVVTVILVRGGFRGAPPLQTHRIEAPGAEASGAVAPAAGSPGARSRAAGSPVVAATPGVVRPDHFSPLDSAPVYAPEIPTAGEPTAAGGDLGAGAPMPGTPAGTPVTGNPSDRAAAFGAPAAANRTPRNSLPWVDTAGADTSAAAGAHAMHRRDPVLTDSDYQPADSEVLPTINELDLSGTRALPELHLDVHVFATKASDRFVYINMRKYHEGATLEEGPTIERIRRDGVILNYQGLRFLLPRH